MDNFYHLPPQNLEAEESLLSACLINGECVSEIIDILKPDDFYNTAHSKIFSAFVSLHKNDEPVDLVSTAEKLKEYGQLEAVGGGAYLNALTNEIPLAVNVNHTVKIIKEKSILRKTLGLAHNIAKQCFKPHAKPEDVLNNTLQGINSIEQSITGGDKWLNIGQILEDRIGEYEKMSEDQTHITGVPSGFVDLDYLTAGFQPADFIILAARPSMGKTSFGLNIANNISETCGTAIFSLEQPIKQLFDRSLSSRARVNMQRIRTGRFSNNDWVNMCEVAGGMSSLHLWVDDSPGLHYSEIRRRARRLMRKADIKLFIVDYLQLCHGDGPVESNEFITSISRAFKELAKELQVPVLALSQLNRKLEDRSGGNKRPKLSDLRGSGSLEQDADVVMFLYRDEVYNQDENNPLKGQAELIVSKQRNGPLGTVNLIWFEQFTRFESQEWRTR